MATVDSKGNAPTHTIYIQKINEKVKKEELLKSLWSMFSQFGEILDICARPKKQKCRGQAWVVYREVSSAVSALKMDGHNFYSNPMALSFSKNKSDAVAKLDGTFVEKRKYPKKKKKSTAPRDEPKSKQRRREPTRRPAADTGPALPNNVLFIENLPEGQDNNQQILGMIFSKFLGYRNVNLVPGSQGVAFVEFESDQTAGVALDNLQGFKFTPQHLLRISYAKK